MSETVFQRIDEEQAPVKTEPTERVSTRVVPWITLWTDELVDADVVWMNNAFGRLTYRDEDASDRFMGVLWVRERIGMSGQPMWKHVHARRQRRAMLDPRCQVCGERLSKVDIPWLLPSTEYQGYLRDTGGTEPMRTITAPTCVECQAIAARRCPRLVGHGFVRAIVKSATPVGVQGDYYAPHQQLPRQFILFGAPELRYTVAKQLCVQLDGMEIIE